MQKWRREKKCEREEYKKNTTEGARVCQQVAKGTKRLKEVGRS